MSAPTAPRIQVRPWPSNQSIKFYWNTPSSDGGSPVQYYTLTEPSAAYSQALSSGVTSYVVSSLTNATNYTFSITATNTNGTSPAATFKTVQPGVSPFGPTSSIASTLTSTTALVTWNLSTVTNEGAPKWFVVTTLPSTTGLPAILKTAYIYERARTFPIASTNTGYQFLVRAVNDTGYCRPFAFTSTVRFVTNVPFSPSSITGNALWLDGSDPLATGTTPANGATVSNWVDKSGSGRHGVQYLTSNLPTFVSNSYNSLGGVNYNGTQLMRLSTVITQLSTIVMVGKNSTNVGEIITGNPVSVGTFSPYYATFRYDTGRMFYLVKTDNSFINAQIVTGSQFNSVSMLSGTNDGATVTASLNGGSSIASQAYTGTLKVASETYIGGGWYLGSVSPNACEFNEIIIYDRYLSPFDRQKTEGYLAWKWGLQGNLPTVHPFKAAAPTATSVFSPSSFSSLQLWMDAADSSAMTLSSGVVTAWLDKSGKGNSTTVVGGGPVLSNNAIGTRSAIWLNGTNTYLQGPYINVGSNMTAFVVATMSNASPVQYRRLLSVGRTGAFNDFDNSNYAGIFMRDALSGANITGYRVNQLASATVSYNTPFFLGSVYTGTMVSTVINGSTATTSTTSGLFSTVNYAIGRDVANATSDFAYWPGYIGEVLIYNNGLFRDDRQTVEGYLAWKWGLQGNLPLTHPYKYRNPASNYNGTSVVPDGLAVNFTATQYSGSGTWSNLGAYGPNFNATVENGTPSLNAASNGVVLNGSTNFTFSNVAVGNAWTATMWIKRTGLADLAACYLTQKFIPSPMNIVLYANYNTSGASATDTQVNGSFYTSAIGFKSGSAITLNSSVWCHVTYTWNGTNLVTYSNGTSIGTTTYANTALDGGGAYNIGRNWDLPNYVRAEIGQVLIYNRAITAAEALQNYNATSSVYTV